jgi:hypothetical protein
VAWEGHRVEAVEILQRGRIARVQAGYGNHFSRCRFSGSWFH